MNENTKLFEAAQYSLPQSEKTEMLLAALTTLNSHHYANCEEYRNIIDCLYAGNVGSYSQLADLPYIPVRLFKNYNLKSFQDESLSRTLVSSGTTSQKASRIFVDKETSFMQTKALVSIISSFVGKKRLPMILIDNQSSISDTKLSARGAGLVGLSNFGFDHFYALNSNMQLRINELKDYTEKHKDTPILIFGFTYIVWLHFYMALLQSDTKINLNQAILIHSGGWKKLEEQSVSNELFKKSLRDLTGISKIYNFYGMVEQIGSVYMECEHGYLHAPNIAEIIVRDKYNFEPLPHGNEGIVQTMSILPHSYPGHSLLTEDMGTVRGVDDCQCGRKGTYFSISGRIPKSEVRGCSDTYSA